MIGGPVSAHASSCRSCAGLDQQLSHVEHLLTRERQRREDAEARAEQYARDALSDPLTSLATRPLLLDRLGVALSRVRRTGLGVGVVAFDLDDFDGVNRDLGRPVGDALLVELAGRLRGLLRPGDTVVRLGGDE